MPWADGQRRGADQSMLVAEQDDDTAFIMLGVGRAGLMCSGALPSHDTWRALLLLGVGHRNTGATGITQGQVHGT